MNRYKSLLFSALLFAVFISYGQTDLSNKSTYYKIDKLIDNIDKMYVEQVDKKLLVKNLIIGMSNQVPIYSGYHKNILLDSLNITKQNKIESIGIKFKFKSDSILIKEVQ